MKILYVDMQYDYGQKSRGPNLIGQSGFLQSMKDLGHTVETFYYDDLMNDSERLHEKLLECVEAQKPDLAFFILFQDQILPKTLAAVSEKTKTMNWFGDDSWRFDNFTSRFAPYFSYPITTDKFSEAKYYELGIKKVLVSQWAAVPEDIPHDPPAEYEYEVSFVGAYHPYRAWVIDRIEKLGQKVHTFGYGWKNSGVSREHMNHVFRHSKVNLNLSNSTSFDLRYLIRSPKNLAYSIKSRKNSSQIKARNFEIPYAGGFQLSDYAPSLEDYYQIGKEVACFTSPDEAYMQIQHYLKNEDLRQSIMKAGVERARAEHTYTHRLKEVFDFIEKDTQ